MENPVDKIDYIRLSVDIHHFAEIFHKHPQADYRANVENTISLSTTVN